MVRVTYGSHSAPAGRTADGRAAGGKQRADEAEGSHTLGAAERGLEEGVRPGLPPASFPSSGTHGGPGPPERSC